LLDSRARLTAPFTFGGTVAGSAGGHVVGGHVELVGPLLFSGSLTGQGTVSVGLIRASAVGGSPSQFALVDLRYSFEQSPASTPEPATVLLLACGVAMGWRRRSLDVACQAHTSAYKA